MSSSFCGIPFQHIEGNPYDWFNMGPDPMRFAAYKHDPDLFDYQHFDQPYVKNAKPSEIGGIFLNEYEFAHPEEFWSNHCQDGTMESFQEIASHIPRLSALRATGENMFKGVTDMASRRCLQIYFSCPADITVVDMGSFLLFQYNGRHRILAALHIDGLIPVQVIGRIVKK